MNFNLLSPLTFAAIVSARTFTVYNACPFTIWPAMHTGGQSADPSYPLGWQADPYTSVSFSVPNNWDSGRIWARRDCTDFSNPDPHAHCSTGGCNGGLVCDPARGGTGVTPATLAEFSLEKWGNLDYYDVSLVDGYNLPVRIDNNKGCPVPKCAIDLGPNCPPQYKGPFNSDGFPVGCKSACVADPTNAEACCLPPNHNTAETCPPSGSGSYGYFKQYCPDAYAYAYDEGSESALWTCNSTLQADYTITFCPPS